MRHQIARGPSAEQPPDKEPLRLGRTGLATVQMLGRKLCAAQSDELRASDAAGDTSGRFLGRGRDVARGDVWGDERAEVGGWVGRAEAVGGVGATDGRVDGSAAEGTGPGGAVTVGVDALRHRY